MRKISLRTFILLFVLFLTACTGSAQIIPTATQTVAQPEPEPSATPAVESAPLPFPTNIRAEDDEEYRIPHMLGFDAIPPIYEPRFVSAEESPLLDEELVMGLAMDGEAKAYSVTVLRSREMVNDEIAGWPVLVTW